MQTNYHKISSDDFQTSINGSIIRTEYLVAQPNQQVGLAVKKSWEELTSNHHTPSHYKICVLSDQLRFNNDFKQFLQETQQNKCKARALVVPHQNVHALIDSYLLIKPNCQTLRCFTLESEAMQWLNKLQTTQILVTTPKMGETQKIK